MQNIVKRIRRDIVSEVVPTTRLDCAEQMSTRLNNQIYLKREDLTAVHSFKLRGAYHKIRSLNSAQLAKGVITCSAGNHAQGVAFSAKKLPHKKSLSPPNMVLSKSNNASAIIIF